MERIRHLLSLITLVFVSLVPLLSHAKVLSCEATKGNGRGWIPREFQIDLASDRKTARVISPVTEVFGAKPFEKSFLGSTLWSRGKGKSKMGESYNYQLRLDLDSNDTEAKVVMTMQGYRDNELRFRCSDNRLRAKTDNRVNPTNIPDYRLKQLVKISDETICDLLSQSLNNRQWYEYEQQRRGLSCSSNQTRLRRDSSLPSVIKLARGSDQSLEINFDEQTAYVKNNSQWFQKVLRSVKRENTVGVYFALIPRGQNCATWVDSNKGYYETLPASILNEGIQIKGLSFLANTSPDSRPDIAFYVREVMPDSSGAWACSSFGNWFPNQRNQLMSYLSEIGAKDPIASLKKKDSEFDYGDELDKTVCFFAVRKTTKGRPDWYAQSAGYVTEAKRRGFTPESCYNLRILATSDSTETPVPANVPNIDLVDLSNDVLCMNLGGPLADRARRELESRETNCEIDEEAVVVSETIDTAEPEELKRLRERLAQLESKQASEQQAIAQDTKTPSIRINTNSDGARGTISGTATDNTGIAEVLVDGQAVPLDSSGRFSTSTFIPSGGIDVQITAYDLKGLSTTETIRLERTKRTQTVSRLAAVNPLVGPKQKTSRDRVALIIGLEEYASAPSADYASRDAQMFADYAREKLGIADNNIKILTDTGASETAILRALKVWLPKAVKPDTTDLYVFYAGHGMPTADGSSAYLVPYDGDIQLLEDTAISRKRFFDEISATKPRSATFFFDNCFSGATRSEELLLASRPLGIKVQETSIPDNYLVFTAGETDQIAGVEPEVKHGRFSYFVFKGLEGEADANQDGKISAGELHAYVRESVGRFSAGAQTPTMLGDGSRWVLR